MIPNTTITKAIKKNKALLVIADVEPTVLSALAMNKNRKT